MSQTLEARRTISTGSVEIDKKMGGGIPEGSLILIEGQSNAGKSVVTQQLTHGALNGGFRCALYTTENTPRSLFRQMTSLSLDVTDFFLLGALNVYPLPAAMSEEAAVTAFDKMLHHLSRLQGRFEVVFIDSLTSFVSQVPESATLRFLTAVKEFCDQNMTIFFTLHSHAFEEAMFMRMRSLCDAHLKLRVEEMRDQLMKVLEVAKVRGAEKSTGTSSASTSSPGSACGSFRFRQRRPNDRCRSGCPSNHSNRPRTIAAPPPRSARFTTSSRRSCAPRRSRRRT